MLPELSAEPISASRLENDVPLEDELLDALLDEELDDPSRLVSES